MEGTSYFLAASEQAHQRLGRPAVIIELQGNCPMIPPFSVASPRSRVKLERRAASHSAISC
jgi:hypothetical protein